MKKIQFKLNELELVKGCPTDINGNGHQDDDYNNDGHTDQFDQDYYDGYMEGYEGNAGSYPGDENDHSDAYNSGYNAGHHDEFWDTHSATPTENPGADINKEDFKAPHDY